MAAPTDTEPRAESDLTGVSNGRADRTVVGFRSVSLPFPVCGFGPPVGPDEIGTLGPYRVVRQLGKGGMGAVYAAIDTRLDRRLALKVMLPECAADADAKERFLREARAAANVTHDNVVTVYEADERDGVPYIAMQFLEGYPLDEFLKKKGAPSIPQTLRVARETAAGLAAAHRIGLVHRDIKPGNLWLEAPNGRVKVLDFGLAKTVHTEVELTQSGMVIGTPAYMSPEQARGKKVDGRSDLFSLGAVLYRLCTGRLPFDGNTTMAVLMALGTEEPQPVRELNPAVPEPLADLVHELLAKEPDDRPQSAAEVVKRLQAIAHSTGASQVVVTPAARVVYVPVQLPTAPEQNPFTDLDATEREPLAPVPSECLDEPASRKVQKKPRVPLLWAAVGVAGLIALSCVAAAILSLRGSSGGTEAKAETPPAAAAKHKPAPALVKLSGATDPDRATAEWVLSVVGAVQVNGEEREIRSAADLPKEKFALTGVNFTDRVISDADLARLKDCQSLTRLLLHGTRVTDAGLAHLKGLTGLAHLSLAHCGITDAGLVALKELPALTRLDLSGTKVIGPGLVNLKATKGLALLLDGTAIPDANLVHLKGLTELIELSLNETPLTDAGLVHLRDLKGLSTLYVRRTRATLPALLALHAFIHTCRIECDGGYIVPFNLNQLVAEWVLSVGGSVSVNGAKHELKTVPELPKGPFALTRVNLSDRPIVDGDLARLAFCRTLTTVILHGTKVTDAGLGYLKNLPELRFLSLTGTKVTDAGLARLKEHKGLQTLHITDTKITDAGLVHLKELTELSELLVSMTPVTDDGLVHLKGLSKLTMLELNYTGVTDKGLGHLKELKGLTRLCVQETAVTPEGAEAFRTAVPGCKIERVLDPQN